MVNGATTGRAAVSAVIETSDVIQAINASGEIGVACGARHPPHAAALVGR
jgi:hypothetical protein